MKMKQIKTRKEWSNAEVKAVAQLYIKMKTMHDNNQHFVKSHMTKPLAEKLGRTVPSIECKMMNISFILDSNGMEWLKGYKPLKNANSAMTAQIAPLFNIKQ